MCVYVCGRLIYFLLQPESFHCSLHIHCCSFQICSTRSCWNSQRSRRVDWWGFFCPLPNGITRSSAHYPITTEMSIILSSTLFNTLQLDFLPTTNFHRFIRDVRYMLLLWELLDEWPLAVVSPTAFIQQTRWKISYEHTSTTCGNDYFTRRLECCSRSSILRNKERDNSSTQTILWNLQFFPDIHMYVGSSSREVYTPIYKSHSFIYTYSNLRK